MEEDERQRLTEQRAANGQTLTFVADRQAEMASAADELAKQDPTWSTVAAMERELRAELAQFVREESETAAELQAKMQADPLVAVLAEQAERNRELLQHVAETAIEADRELRG